MKDFWNHERENIMSHYSDCYYKANKELFERESKAERYRKEMLDNLGTYEMIRLMFADFIHPGFIDGIDNVLVISGIDEHGYVWKADEIRKRMGINMTISGLYSKMMRGINDYPKMSKSIPNSNIDLSCTKEELKQLLTYEKFNYDDAENSFVYQLMCYVSFYDEEKLSKLKKDCNDKNDKWKKDIEIYINDLYKMCKLWR